LLRFLTQSQFLIADGRLVLHKNQSMTKAEIKRNAGAVIVFYLIAISCRYATNKTGLLAHIDHDFFRIVVQGVGPAVAALFVFKVFRIKPQMTLTGGYLNKWIPLFIFWILPVVAIVTFAYLSTAKWSFFILPILIYALLEEIGWRGFLQPALSFLPKFAGILIVTILWFIWHLNFAFTTSSILFFGVLLLGSWGMAAISRKTNSVLAVSAFHAAYDVYAAVEKPSVYFMVLLAVIFLIWLLAVIFYDELNKKLAGG
jgi:membrane protease YdiL (CAAX protease family)